MGEGLVVCQRNPSALAVCLLVLTVFVWEEDLRPSMHWQLLSRTQMLETFQLHLQWLENCTQNLWHQIQQRWHLNHQPYLILLLLLNHHQHEKNWFLGHLKVWVDEFIVILLYVRICSFVKCVFSSLSCYDVMGAQILPSRTLRQIVTTRILRAAEKNLLLYRKMWTRVNLKIMKVFQFTHMKVLKQILQILCQTLTWLNERYNIMTMSTYKLVFFFLYFILCRLNFIIKSWFHFHSDMFELGACRLIYHLMNSKRDWEWIGVNFTSCQNGNRTNSKWLFSCSESSILNHIIFLVLVWCIGLFHCS